MSRRWLLPGLLLVALFSAGCFSVGTMFGRAQVNVTTAQLNDSKSQLSTATAQLNTDKPIVDVYGVKQIEVVFHQALASRDVDMIMSIFADDAVTERPRSETSTRQSRRPCSPRTTGRRWSPHTGFRRL